MENDYDIIHIHSPFAMGTTLLKLAKRKNIPIVATAHTNFRPIFRAVVPIKPIVEYAIGLLGKFYNKLNEVFVVSKTVEDQTRSFGYTGKISYMPFGTDTEKPKNLDELIDRANRQFSIGPDETVFLFVGRVVPLKRVGFVLDSLKLLKDEGQKFRFYIVGKGIGENKLKRQAKRLGFTGDEVIFTGFMDSESKNLLYARADLFLFPSLYDNFGLVKVEAACFSTPAVLIRGSATADGVTDGINGYLCDNTTAAFADRIRDALSDRDALKKVGENAANDLYFNWRECADLLLIKYGQIIDEHKKTKEV
jgi:glycosyltransferase involved in cell wall biosynthesis